MKLLKVYLKLLERRPVIANSLTFGGLMGFGDLLCQTCIEQRQNGYSFFAAAPLNGNNTPSEKNARKKWDDIDWTRTMRFVTIGSIYYGPAVTIWYRCLDKFTFKILRSTSSKRKLGACKMMIDQVGWGIVGPPTNVMYRNWMIDSLSLFQPHFLTFWAAVPWRREFSVRTSSFDGWLI